MSEKIDETKIVNILIPKVEIAMKALIEGKFNEKLPEIKNALQSELWDKAVAEIGRVTGLPDNVIKGLQQIDDVIKNKSGELANLIETIEGFKDKLKGIDVHKTIVMSYKELQKVKVKASSSWLITGLLLGFFIGVFIASKIWV